jgi:hypothetical protein
MREFSFSTIKSWWFNPRDGVKTFIGESENQHVISFNPRRERQNGNDCVLILEILK